MSSRYIRRKINELVAKGFDEPSSDVNCLCAPEHYFVARSMDRDRYGNLIIQLPDILRENYTTPNFLRGFSKYR